MWVAMRTAHLIGRLTGVNLTYLAADGRIDAICVGRASPPGRGSSPSPRFCYCRLSAHAFGGDAGAASGR